MERGNSRYAWLLTGWAILSLLPGVSRAQISPEQANALRTALGARIEALTILGGDFGLSDGRYTSTESNALTGGDSHTDLSVWKVGGEGDVGDPQQLGDWDIGWQPHLQGNMGFLESTNHLLGPLVGGDVSTYHDFAIQFGGGARFWVSDALSFAPSVMGMYGRTSNSYEANSAFARANLALARQSGLIDWGVDTWTIRSAMDIQYLIRWERIIVTLTSDPTFFHTESFNDSAQSVRVRGNSGSVDDKVDIDIPLGMELFGHELRTGGYLSRSDLFGDLKTGLNVQHISELHVRLVLDFLNQFWKAQWFGVGASYLSGPNISGWSVDLDAAWRF